MQINNALINILLYYFSDLYPGKKKIIIIQGSTEGNQKKGTFRTAIYIVQGIFM